MCQRLTRPLESACHMRPDLASRQVSGPPPHAWVSRQIAYPRFRGLPDFCGVCPQTMIFPDSWAAMYGRLARLAHACGALGVEKRDLQVKFDYSSRRRHGQDARVTIKSQTPCGPITCLFDRHLSSRAGNGPHGGPYNPTIQSRLITAGHLVAKMRVAQSLIILSLNDPKWQSIMSQINAIFETAFPKSTFDWR